jgi:hypothetical protein
VKTETVFSGSDFLQRVDRRNKKPIENRVFAGKCLGHVLAFGRILAAYFKL